MKRVAEIFGRSKIFLVWISEVLIISRQITPLYLVIRHLSRGQRVVTRSILLLYDVLLFFLTFLFIFLCFTFILLVYDFARVIDLIIFNAL